jgi:hypothetical protein
MSFTPSFHVGRTVSVLAGLVLSPLLIFAQSSTAPAKADAKKATVAPAGPGGGAPSKKGLPVKIADADRERLTSSVASLSAVLSAFEKDAGAPAELRALGVDVAVLLKAVAWPLKYNEFYDAKQVAAADALLKEAASRLDALKAGKAPWTTATGLVVRGYRSLVDDSVQPYGLVIPEDWKPGAEGFRVDVWLHGRGDQMTELSFLQGRMKSPGEFTPPKTIVLHPYGRMCNAYKFAGETDVFESVDAVVKGYGIAGNRVTLRGFSMGGAGSWHLGARHTGRWAAIAPGAGFAETAEYAKVFGEGRIAPNWWEQTLWRMYDATGYVGNLFNRPVIAYSGADDPQIQSTRKMEEAAGQEGLSIRHLIGPNTGHKYHPDTKKQLNEEFDTVANRVPNRFPQEVRLVTYSHRTADMDWIHVDSLEQMWERAEVRGKIEGDVLVVAAKNVRALSLDHPAEAGRASVTLARIDGTTLPLAKRGRTAFVREGGAWKVVSAPGAGLPGLRKRAGLEGPIDDVYFGRFAFVVPTGTARDADVARWAEAEMKRAVADWRAIFRGDVIMVRDTDVTPEFAAQHHLVLWGDPGSNKVLARVLGKLPVKWTGSELELGSVKGGAAARVPVMVYPNPEAPERYVLVNSGFTFREGLSITNALQVPRLPDWAVIDISVPADNHWPGQVVDAGFFGSDWQVTGGWTK